MIQKIEINENILYVALKEKLQSSMPSHYKAWGRRCYVSDSVSKTSRKDS